MLLKTAYRVGYLRALQDAGVDASYIDKCAIDMGIPARKADDPNMPIERLTKGLTMLGDEEEQGPPTAPKVRQLEPEQPKSYFQFSKGRSIASDTLTNLGIDFRGPMDTGAL